MAKTLWLFNLILFFSILKSDNVFSQAPNLINYQGVARNAAGNPLQNQTIYLRVNIRTGSSQGAIQFSETRSVKTNAWGLFAVQIGSPGFMSSIGTLAGVTWMQGDKFMEVEIDPTASNNYINLGSTQLLSVPYALNAVSAGTASPIGGAGGDLSGSYPNPTIANNKITSLKLADSSVVTSKVANYSITDIKIESVSGSKIIGDIIGNAKNVNGIVAIANGGTGASNTSDAKKNLLIDSVDNTTDLRKPISIATQNALNLKLNISDTLGTFSNRLKMSDTAAMLSNRLKISDTASMLANRLKISDTANFVSNYRRASTKIENTDLSKSTISGVSLGDNLKSLSTSYGLSGTGFNGSADISNWKVDTAAISTKANVTALLEGYTTTGSIATKLNISDTASMLSNRLKISDTANFVSNYRRTTTKIENIDLSKSTISGVSLGDNLKSLSASYGLSGTGFNGSADISNWKVDTAAISTKANVTALLEGYTTTGSIATKLNISDTASMLSNRLKISDTASMLANRFKISDTTSMLANRLMISDTASMLSNRLKISDTASFVSNYRRTTTKIENADLSKSTISGVSLGDNLKSLSASYGLSGTGFNGSADISNWKVDTAAISTKANVTALLEGYTTTGSIATKLNISDTASMLSNRLKISDTANFVLNYRRTTTKIENTDLSKSTISGVSLGDNLKSLSTSYGLSGTGFNGSADITDWKVDTSAISTKANVTGLLAGYATTGSVGNLDKLTDVKSGGENFSNSIIVGHKQTGTLSNASQNTVLGLEAFKSVTSATNNTVLGFNAMRSNLSGSNNVALGSHALLSNTTGSDNISVGYNAMLNNVSAIGNVAIGSNSLNSGTTGNYNVAVGHQSMVNNTTGDVNTALGYTSLYGNTTGRYNVALGVQALESNTTGNNNTAIGVGTLDRNTGGNENAILGAFAGRYIADGSTYNTTTSNSVLLGANIRVNGVGQSNQIVIGHNAIGNGSNTIQLGNTNITNVKTSGTITAGAVTYPNVDGNSGDLLTTNGSGVVSFIAPTLVREVADEFSATANQTSFTLTQTKAANSKVKMFINGVRISNTAYSVVGTTLTYIPANNGNTNLTLNDRIQFDYYY